MRIKIPTCKKILTEETYTLLSVNDLFNILKIFSVMKSDELLNGKLKYL